MSDALAIVIVDPETSVRNRLKEICLSVERFHQIELFPGLCETIRKLSSRSKKIDIICLSSRFLSEEVSTFIHEAKKVPNLEDTTFILLKRLNEKITCSEDESGIVDADGVLFKPFSNISIDEICDLAVRIQNSRRAQRLMDHLHETIDDILAIINQIAFLQASNFVFIPVLKQLRRLTSLMQSLPEDHLSVYYLALQQRLDNPPRPGVFPVRYRYSGKSLRARKRLQKKALQALGYDVTGL